ncbi:S-layer homology domain-containing protein [Paenibacillus sp. CAU 1782]
MKRSFKKMTTLLLAFTMMLQLLQSLAPSSATAADEGYIWIPYGTYPTAAGGTQEFHYYDNYYYLHGAFNTYRSTDLMTWELFDSGSISDIDFIGNYIYVTRRTGTVPTLKRLNPDGTWYTYSNTITKNNIALSSIAYNGTNRYVMSGGNTYALYTQTSSTGVPEDKLWTVFEDEGAYRFDQVVYYPRGNRFIATDWKGRLAYSSNGSSWTYVTIQAPSSNSSIFGSLVVEANRVLVPTTVGLWEAFKDGSNTVTRLRTGNTRALVHNGSQYIAAGPANSMLSSSDMTSWTSESIPGTAYTLTHGHLGTITSIGTQLYLRIPYPSIAQQPQNQSVAAGGAASFDVSLSSPGAVYQWQRATPGSSSFSNMNGQTSPTYQISNAVTGLNGYRFRVVVTYGSVVLTSDPATLTIVEPTQITSQPAKASGVTGGSVTFKVAATGSNLQYQWKSSVDGIQYTDIAGATGSQLELSNLDAAVNGTSYIVEITGNGVPAVESSPARLAVYPKEDFTPNEEIVVLAGEDAVIATLPNTPDVQYQWQVNKGQGFLNLPDATSPSLTLENAAADMDGYSYRLVTTGELQYISDEAKLTVNTPTTVENQPAEAVAYAGQRAYFQVAASGKQLSYQWFVDASGTGSGTFAELPGETSATLSLPNVGYSMNGYVYKAVISGRGVPDIETVPAALHVLDSPGMQPLPVTTVEGESAVFNGPVPEPGMTLHYQWQVDFGNGFADIPDATAESLSLNQVTTDMNGYQYRLIVSGDLQTEYISEPAQLTVYPSAHFTLNEVATVTGRDAELQIEASGPGLIYIWYVDTTGTGDHFEQIDGAGGRTLTLEDVNADMNGYLYKVVVDGELHTPYSSNSMAIKVYSADAFNASPRTAIEEQDVQFYFSGSGEGLTYQWQVDTGSGLYENINGATGATLSLTHVTTGMDGHQYRVIVGGALQPALETVPAVLSVSSKSDFVPESVYMFAGGPARFAITSSNSVLTYQWQVDPSGTGSRFEDIPGATGTELELTDVSADLNGYLYRVVVGGELQTAFVSPSAKLNVFTTESLQPAAVTTVEGMDATFDLPDGGNGLAYQWQVDTTGTGGNYADIPGAAGSQLKLENVTADMNGYLYRVSVGGITQNPFHSDGVPLKVIGASGLQPDSATGVTGMDIELALPGGAQEGLTYQWQVDSTGTGNAFANIPGAIGSTLDLLAVADNMDGHLYRVVVSGTLQNPFTSEAVSLHVYETEQLQPSAIALLSGEDAELSVPQPGNGLAYQWQVDTTGSGRSFENIAGATGATLELREVNAETKTHLYRVVISGVLQKPFTAEAVNINVLTDEELQQSPVAVVEGQKARFEIEAEAAGLHYQWQVDSTGTGNSFADIAGETSRQLELAHPATDMNGYLYRVIVGGLQSPFQSTPTALTVYSSEQFQPGSATAVAGSSVEFAISGSDGLTYQWQVDTTGTGDSFTTIDGATDASLELDNLTGEMNGYLYRLIVSGELQTPFIAENAKLNVFTSSDLQPLSVAALAGENTTLSVAAAGEGLTYQWQVATESGGAFINIDGATGQELNLQNVARDMDGYRYRVVIGGVLQPAFTSEPATLSVHTPPGAPTGISVTPGSGSVRVSFTPPLDTGGLDIIEYQVISHPDGIAATGATSPITVSGLTNGKAYTFTVTAVTAAGAGQVSEFSKEVTPYQPSSTVTAAPYSSVEVWVNGKAEHAGKATTGMRDGQQTTTIEVDEFKLSERLAAEGSRPVITIPVNGQSDVIISQLNGRMVKGIEQRQGTIEIRTSSAIYTLPAGQINMDAVSEQIGRDIPLQDIKIAIEIGKPSEQELIAANIAALNGTLTLVAPPLQFTITAAHGDKRVQVSRFDTYVERKLLLPDGIDHQKVTTGVVIEPDGSFRHVPTKVEVLDGKFYTQINSLTNSLYSVVWNPLAFSDMELHWGKEAVNDMGSRLVVSGSGNGLFQPDKAITRAEFAAIVVRALGLKAEQGPVPFEDVQPSQWYAGAVATASAYGLINGYEDGTFHPSETITREQAMAILYSAMHVTGLGTDRTPNEELLAAYQDENEVSGWARNAVSAVLTEELVFGRGPELLAPKATVTRAEVALLVQRLLKQSGLI